MLEESITETQWAAWKPRFDQYCVACKHNDKNIENCVFETISSSLADQISVDLTGDETKDELFGKFKAAIVKKLSIFLFWKDFHKLTQIQGGDLERFAALNK